jgi:hypothetical protein
METMKTRNGFPGRILMVALAAMTTASWVAADDLSEDAPIQDGSATHCEWLPAPAQGNNRIADFGLEWGSTPWILQSGKIYYWDGKKFREPATDSNSHHSWGRQFHGGGDRPLYVTRSGQKPHIGNLYRLDDGAATLVTTYYFDESWTDPCFYVSRSGVLYNWGKRFLARFDGKTWNRIETPLSSKRTAVFEIEDAVYFYHGNHLCRADASGKLSELPCPTFPTTKQGYQPGWAVPWGGNRVLLTNPQKRRLYAFDLTTGKEINLLQPNAGHSNSTFHQAYVLKDGQVWIHAYTGGKNTFLSLSDDGRLTTIDPLHGVPWNATSGLRPSDRIAQTSKGDIFFGFYQAGIARFRDGELSRWGWRHGFKDPVRRFVEDRNGAVWFAQKNDVVKMRVGDGPPPILPELAVWDEIELVRYNTIWEPKPGLLAMLRKDKPNHLSWWDGTRWTHQEVPFRSNHYFRACSDDQGHLLLTSSDHRQKAYDVTPDSIEEFPDAPSLFRTAIARGAKFFRPDEPRYGVVFTPAEQLWFGGNQQAHLVDSRGDAQFRVGHGLYAIFPSHDYGVLFLSGNHQLFRYDRGQMAEVPPRMNERLELMIGPSGLQPYDAAIMKAQPRAYLPVLRQNQYQLRLFNDVETFQAAVANKQIDQSAHAFPLRYEQNQRLRPAALGGYWVDRNAHSMSSRLFGDRFFGTTHYNPFSGEPKANNCIQVDLTKLPLPGQVQRLMQDAGGNLWFCCPANQKMSVFMLRQSKLHLKAETPPKKVGRKLVLPVAIHPKSMANDVHLFTRVNKGPWRYCGVDKDTCTFLFPESGDYECEVTGIRYCGRLHKTLSFRVTAKVKPLDTVLTGSVDKTKPITVDRIMWRPPVAVRGTPAGNARIAWRNDDGPWQTADKDGSLDLTSLKPGMHTIEFAAQEEGIWRDPTPVRLKVRFTPDYDKIVYDYLCDLGSNQSSDWERATKALKRIGKKHLPLLRTKLAEARRIPQGIYRLQQIVQELERAERSPFQ